MAGCLEPQPYLWILLSSHALLYAKLKNPKKFQLYALQTRALPSERKISYIANPLLSYY